MDLTSVSEADVTGISSLWADSEEDAEKMDQIIGSMDSKLKVDNSDKYKEELDKMVSGVSDFSFSEATEAKEDVLTDKSLADVTLEQKRHAQITQVLGNPEIATNFQSDMDIKTKSYYMEQIGRLKQSLKAQYQNIDDIHPVTYSSSIDDIKIVYDILHKKNRQARYVNIGRELLTSFAHLVESAFDGKREYFGMKPDLTGWSDTVRVKARNLDYELSSMVDDMMGSSNMSNAAVLGLELVPSAIVYSRSRTKTKEEPIDDAGYSQALEKLNSH